MKKLLSFFFILYSIISLNAQVGINTNTPKATFKVSASETTPINIPPGIIDPKVSLNFLISNSDKYTNDQKGTIVYVNDINSEEVNPITLEIKSTGYYYYYDGNKWVLFVIPDEVNIPMEPWRVEGTGVEPTYNTQNIVQNAKVGIGFSNSINSSAQFEIRSNDGGLLIPRMTSSQIEAISEPANSLMIFNTDTSCFNFYKKDRWKSLCGDLGTSEIEVQDCQSIKINGELKEGQVVNNNNFLQLTVSVNEPGDYTFLANNLSTGIFFEKSGSFPNTGFYTINM